MTTWAEIAVQNIMDALEKSAKIYQAKPDSLAYDLCNTLKSSLQEVIGLFHSPIVERQENPVTRHILP